VTAEEQAGVEETPATETETWTYGGLTAGAGKARRAIWFDADRRRWLFAPVTGTHPVVGCDYTVEATRTEDAEKITLHRHSVPHFEGRNADSDWAAALEAAAHLVEMEAATDAMERRAGRDAELDRAIAPLERIAAGMTYAQRSALVDLVTRKIYRVDRRGK
jgi:hypothetical protein